jgi:hypothetical protein
LGVLIAVARSVLAVAVLIETRAETISAVARSEILLVLGLRLPIELLGRTVSISIGLGSAMNGTLDDSGLELVALALGRILAVLVLIAVLAIGTAVLLLKLLVVSLSGRKNPQVMFCMLEIAFRHDDIAGSHRIPAKLKILVGDGLGGAADLYIWSVAFIDAIERIAATTPASSATTTMATITVTPALFMLPWSHTLLMLLSELMTG